MLTNVVNLADFKRTKETKAHNDRVAEFDWGTALEAAAGADDDSMFIRRAIWNPTKPGEQVYWRECLTTGERYKC